MKENQKALEAYDQGLRLDPNNAEIKAGIQKVMNQISSGQDEESVRRNVERDPELQVRYSRYSCSLASENLGRPNDASRTSRFEERPQSRTAPHERPSN